MTYSIIIEIGFTGSSNLDKTELAARYADKVINEFPEIEWCDVEVHEAGKPNGKKGFSRNPPPLRRCIDCKYCFIGADNLHCYCRRRNDVMRLLDTCGDYLRQTTTYSDVK